MKIIDERETQKKKHRQKRKRGTKTIVKGSELNDFVISLSFLQLIWKATLIFKSYLE